MNRALKFISRIWKYNFWFAIIYFVVMVGFFDQYSVFRLVQLMVENRELTAQIGHYEKQYEEATKALEQMGNSPKAIERIARIKLKMKNDNEDVYVVVEE